MEKLLIVLIDSILVTWSILYISAVALKKRISYKEPKYWILFIISTLYIMGSYLLTDSFVRVIISYLLLLSINLYLYKESVVKITLASFATMVITLISEIIYTIVLVYILKLEAVDLQNAYFGQIFTNFVIVAISCVMVNIKFVKKWLNDLVENATLENNKMVLLFSVLTFTVIVMVIYYIYFKADLTSAFILSLIVIISFVSITLFLFKEKNDNYRLQLEYDNLLTNLQEYEKMYQIQRMANHEHKNELSIIRGMVHKNNTKLIEYLNSLINIQDGGSKKWLDELKKIPEGGMRGLLYYKFLLLEKENISIDFKISREVKINTIKKINQKTKEKLCKILGIYLDNSRQAVEKLNKKVVTVNFYIKDESQKELVITIMNNFNGKVDLERINEKGYSTKGRGRGLGLTIAQEILNTSSDITHQTKIIRNNFMQELRIKI